MKASSELTPDRPARRASTRVVVNSIGYTGSTRPERTPRGVQLKIIQTFVFRHVFLRVYLAQVPSAIQLRRSCQAKWTLLKEEDIAPSLITWVEFFLSRRTFLLNINGTLSRVTEAIP